MVPDSGRTDGEGARSGADIGDGIAGGDALKKPPENPGRLATATLRCAAFMKRAQISAGRPPPVIFLVGEESSFPSHTPATSCAV